MSEAGVRTRGDLLPLTQLILVPMEWWPSGKGRLVRLCPAERRLGCWNRAGLVLRENRQPSAISVP